MMHGSSTAKPVFASLLALTGIFAGSLVFLEVRWELLSLIYALSLRVFAFIVIDLKYKLLTKLVPLPPELSALLYPPLTSRVVYIITAILSVLYLGFLYLLVS